MGQIELIPNWKIELVEQKGAHFYTIDGQNLMLPSSTTILGRVLSKPILVPWAVKMAGVYLETYLKRISDAVNSSAMADKLRYRFFKKKQIDRLVRRMKRQYKYERDRAADIGTRAHQYFDDLQTKTPQLAPPQKDIEMAILNYDGWQEQTKLKIVQGDTGVCSLKYGYAGKLDGIVLAEDGKLEILDYKTSNYSGKEHAYQVASYAVAAQETFNLPYLPNTRIIRFDKNKPLWEERRIINTQSAFDGFLLCLNLYSQLDIEHFEIVCSNHKAVANEKIRKPRQKTRR